MSLIQHFEADFPKSQPQNPEFRNNPENFHLFKSKKPLNKRQTYIYARAPDKKG